MRPSWCFAVIVVLLLMPICARPDAFTLKGGLSVWPDVRNSDELEANEAPGPLIGLGYETDLSLGRLEFEGTLAWERIHGINNRQPRPLGDQDLWVGTAMVNLWRDIADPVYVGGGLGGAVLYGLDDTALTPAGQLGGGAIFDLSDDLSLDLGYRYLYTFPVDLDGSEAEYDSHRLLLGLRWKF